MGIKVTGGVKVPQGKFSVYVAPGPAAGNELWTWGGYNGSGQLGLGDTTNRSSPVQVGSLTDWASVFIGRFNTSAIKTDGSLWIWGHSASGRLGNGTSSGHKSSPIQLGALIDWSAVYHGTSHSVARKTDGSLWIWGSGIEGKLGLGDYEINRSSPVQVGTLTDWVNISAGNHQTLAVKTNGSLWAWGHNGSGRLGLGNTASRSSPTQVGILTNWADVATANDHSLAVKTDGTLWSWGNGDFGRTGHGDQIDRSSPVQIGSLTDWASVNTGHGAQHSVARKTDGTLWAWGNNNAGRLGDSSGSDKSSPVPIGALTDWASIDAGTKHSVARKTDGSIWSWGDNQYEADGALGLGDISNRNSPVQIGSLTTWTSIEAAHAHNVALKTTT